MPPPSAPPDTAAEVGLIVGLVIAGLLVVVLGVLGFFKLRKRKQAVAPS